MSNYVDGFVFPIPKDKLERFREIAAAAGEIWMEHGALSYWECVGDDLEIPDQVPFPLMIKAGPDETVGFSWIVYKSREHRDEVNAKVMEDPRMAAMMDGQDPPIDYKRMAYGGFTPLVSF